MIKLLSIMVFLLSPYAINHTAVSKELPNYSIPCDGLEFSPDNLKKYLVYKKVKHPDIVYAQALIETGNFTSRIFLENHNVVGMRFVDTVRCKALCLPYRSTVASGERYKHAYYISWQRSIDDYLLWQQMFKHTPIDTREQYLKMLDGRYAEDKRYVKVIKFVLNREKRFPS